MRLCIKRMSQRSVYARNGFHIRTGSHSTIWWVSLGKLYMLLCYLLILRQPNFTGVDSAILSTEKSITDHCKLHSVSSLTQKIVNLLQKLANTRFVLFAHTCISVVAYRYECVNTIYSRSTVQE